MSTLINAMSKAMSSVTLDGKEHADWQIPHDLKHKRDAYLKDNGWVRIGQGAFKTVWAKNNVPFCVKTFPETFGNKDSGGGALELENYENAPEELKPFLLPILAHGKGWMIQERLSMPSENDMGARARLCARFGCDGYVDGVCDSGTTNHTHREDGTLVIFDYGQRGQWHPVTKKRKVAA